MVEAQGKGTLHCHMLIWLEGHLSPQALRDKMAENTDFKNEIFEWLESLIKCQLSTTNEVITEKEGVPLQRPPRADPHPGTLPGPSLSHFTVDEFELEFKKFTDALAQEFNWHEHNATCWKHLKPGDKRDDAHCRMRINGSTNPETHLDDNTKSIILKRLHPRINNYTDLITFLLKCNMDIKFIGSGEAAKALVYYITDYITKSSLPTHVGLAALAYVLRQNLDSDSQKLKPLAPKTFMTKCVNAMMGRQEISHQMCD